ncbi:MAG: sugar phosphate nucleotidyltransferase [Pelolinea sp.]|nr:sugar phosphate nucleotidyltransferase [Pelolinea sp.]
MSKIFTIAIPMAGLGTRMRPQTWSKPKPLIHLAGRTVLDYVLDQFQSIPRFKDARFVLILGPHQDEQVIPYMKENHPDKEVHYVIQEEMRGQSDALYLAKEYLQGPMLMAFSDTLIESDLSFLDDEQLDGVAWVKQVPDPRRFGVAEVNENGHVSRLIEKPKEMDNNLVVVGFYYFKNGNKLMLAIEQQIKENIALNEEYFLADAINLMIKDGAVMRVQPVAVWLDAGKPGTLLETNRHLLENGNDNSSEAAKRKNVTILPPVYIHPKAEIKNCVIGPFVSISQGAVIEDTILKNSIVEQDAIITNLVLENSLIGRTAAVRGRAETMNIGDNSWIEI